MVFRLLSASVIVILSGFPTGAQPFSRYFDERELVPDSSQIIAERIVKSNVPVVVDFWAAWCVPCRLINPMLEKLEKAYRGRVLFMRVNVDYNRQIAAYFGVQGIPAVFIIKDRTVQRSLMGIRPEAEYRRVIEEVLAVPAAKPAEKDTALKDTGKTTKTAKRKKKKKG